MESGTSRTTLKATLVCAGLLLYSSPGAATCLSLVKGMAAIDVESCIQANPERLFDLSKPDFKWINDLDKKSRADFMATYRGHVLKAKVVQSDAVESGLGNTANLRGETKIFFIPPNEPVSCQKLSQQRIIGTIDEVCCEGGGKAPCLLGTGLTLRSVSAIGQAGSTAGDANRQKSRSLPEYKKADAAFAKKDYKSAAAQFEILFAQATIDVRGLYRLGLSYRNLDQCGRAIKPLEKIFNEQGKGKVWADEEQTARDAIFLLARCYARQSDASSAVLVLQGYLLEPRKYRDELQSSLRHKDFGYIRTTKEYQTYAKDAREKLGQTSVE
jgi:hypothetical protein